MRDKIALCSTSKNNITYISNDFIDIFMPESSGEFVKTYLYLLRALSNNTFSISKAAKDLHHTEKDIINALSYWKDKGLLDLEYDNHNNIKSMCICDVNNYTDINTINNIHSNNKADTIENININFDFNIDKEDSIKDTTLEFHTEEIYSTDLSEIFSFAEAYKGKPLSSNELEFINSWNSELKFSPSLIKYLIDTCANEGHMSFYYMNKVALNWKENNIKTVEEATLKNNIHSKTYYTIIKAFGIQGRSLNSKEEDFMNKWVSAYNFSDDIIEEACIRALSNTGKISFVYADKILSDWNTNQIRSISDVQKKDSNKYKNSSKKIIKNTNKFSNFNNFEQRTDSLSALELERKLLK